MAKITINLSEDIALWLKGYAASRKLSPSRTVSDLLIEKRACLSQQAKELHAVVPLIERLSKIKLD